jgi:hypothetical protein
MHNSLALVELTGLTGRTVKGINGNTAAPKLKFSNLERSWYNMALVQMKTGGYRH